MPEKNMTMESGENHEKQPDPTELANKLRRLFNEGEGNIDESKLTEEERSSLDNIVSKLIQANRSEKD